MLTLKKTELVERLEQIASAQKLPAEELLNQAVSEYLEKVAHQKIQAENKAYRDLHPQLVNDYLGDYVAIHNGQVVDHDPEVRSLHLRIRQKFGRTPVLLRQVTSKTEPPDLVFRSPKLEPIE